ncbi:hypothetical protein T484DRAFT_1791403 [Baffinella frigidus]|nr:hypothetical protein T484DRAFT_1791403 [Cryptophyta sp. CCMP2293]
MPGRPALWLLACILTVLPLSGSTARYQLGLVADGGACLMKTSWAAGCSTLTNQGIPAITVGLFTSGGAPCCGQTPVSVHVSMRKGDREGSTMRVTFSGLAAVDPLGP